MAFEYLHGKISHLEPKADYSYIQLDSTGNRNFKLLASHPGYNSIYSLVVAAAVNRYSIALRTEDAVPPNPPSDVVQYIVVEW